MAVKFAPDGMTYHCFVEGCYYIHRDGYEVSGRHFGKTNPAHPNHEACTEKWSYQKIREHAHLITIERGEEIGREGQDARREKNREQTATRKRLAIRANPHQSAPESHSPAVSRSASRPRPLTLSAPTPPTALSSRLLTPLPTPEPSQNEEEVNLPDDKFIKYRCYHCKTFLARKDYVKTHFLRQHSDLQEVFRPTRVPAYYFSKTTFLPIGLAKEQWHERQKATLDGIAPEVRDLIWQQLLVASRHPDDDGTPFSIEPLLYPRYKDEALEVMKSQNYIVRLSFDYADDDWTMGKVERAVLEPIRDQIPSVVSEMLGKPALLIRLGVNGASRAARSTRFSFPYHEKSFIYLLRNIMKNIATTYDMSLTFNGSAELDKNEKTTTDVLRYISYVRGMRRMSISGFPFRQDITGMTQRMKGDFTAPSSVVKLLVLMLRDTSSFLHHKQPIRALTTAKFAYAMYEMAPELDTDDEWEDDLWRNGFDELSSRVALEGIKTINCIADKAIEQGALRGMSLETLQAAIEYWATLSFGHSVITEAHRAKTHHARAIAYRHVAEYHVAGGGPTDLVTARSAWYKACMDLHFASLLAKDGFKDQIITEKQTIEAKIGHSVGNFQVWYTEEDSWDGYEFKGDHRQLIDWGDDFRMMKQRQERIDGWEEMIGMPT